MLTRHRNILDFAISSLLRRKGKNGALLLVYTLVVFLLATTLFFSSALRHEAGHLLDGVPEVIVQRTISGRWQPVPAAWGTETTNITGVREVRRRLWGYQYDRDVKANYTLMVPVDTPAVPEGSIDIGSGISRIRKIGPGDTMVFRGNDGTHRSYRIRALFDHESELLTSDLILMAEQDFRDLSGTPSGMATDLAVRVSNQKEIDTVAEKISQRLPDSRIVLKKEISRTYDALFNWRSGIVITILSTVFLAFLILAWEKATGLSAEERREIGILRATGWNIADVMLLKLWEGAAVSLSASLAGTLLAFLHVFHAKTVLFSPLLKGWSTLYPVFRLTPFIDAGQLAALFFLSVVPYALCTLIPSWRAATIDPDTVMR